MFLNTVWFGNIALSPHRTSLMVLAFFFPPALFALKYEDLKDRQDESQVNIRADCTLKFLRGAFESNEIGFA